MSKTIDIFRNFFKTSKNIANVNISEVIEDTILFLDSTFEVENITINKDIEKDIIILAIQEEFAHSILNILVNAKDVFKTRKVPNPTININMYKDGKKIIITIEDNAGGIELTPIEQIFKSGISSKSHGGIGLYITKKIIEEKLGGDIGVENINKGVKFTIII